MQVQKTTSTRDLKFKPLIHLWKARPLIPVSSVFHLSDLKTTNRNDIKCYPQLGIDEIKYVSSR